MHIFHDGSSSLIDRLLNSKVNGNNGEKNVFNEICKVITNMTDQYRVIELIGKLERLGFLKERDIERLKEKGIILNLDNDNIHDYDLENENVIEFEQDNNLNLDDGR